MGSTIIERMMPAVRIPTPKLGPSKRPVQPKVFKKERTNGGAHERNQYKDSPQTINHAGYWQPEAPKERILGRAVAWDTAPWENCYA